MLSVTVYSTGPACMRCKMTKDKLEAKGVHVDVVELAENPAAREYVTEELGYSEAPWSLSRTAPGRITGAAFDPTRSTASRPRPRDRLAGRGGDP